MTNSSLTTKHCASAAAQWLQGVSSIVVSVSGFKYGPNTGLEIDRMTEVRG